MVMNYFVGILYMMHGLVHLLYMGHAFKYFEIEKGFVWPDNSKLLANRVGLKTKQRVAGILGVIATLSFVLAGVSALIGHSWHNQVVVAAVIASTLLFIAFWDGTTSKLHTQGGIGILINALILAYTII
jgi:hypothetical protein